MASEIKSDKLSPSTGTALQIGDASDTITIPTGATFTITDGLPVASGGTGIASFTAGDVLYATGTTTLAKLAKGTAEQILSMNSGATAPEWATAAATAGGTGQTGFTAGDILYANSTTTLTKLGKGTGLQGLQTNSGATAPEWANSPQSLMTAAGDILYASGANTLAKLAKGSDDEVLTLASGVPSWAASAAGGKIGQFISYYKNNFTTHTATTFTEVALDWNGTADDLVITPSATSSKIWVQGHFWWSNTSTNTNHYQMWREVSGGSNTQINLATGGDFNTFFGSGLNGGLDVMRAVPFSYLDSPSTTSEITYTFQFKVNGNVGYVNRRGNSADGSGTSTCNLVEILA